MPGIVDERYLLMCDVKGQSVAELERSLEKPNAEHVNGDAAGPKLERAVCRPFIRYVIWQVAVFNDLQPIVDHRKHAESILWSLLSNCHRGELRVGE